MDKDSCRLDESDGELGKAEQILPAEVVVLRILGAG